MLQIAQYLEAMPGGLGGERGEGRGCSSNVK